MKLHKCMTFKVVKKISLIVAMKLFTKPNYNPCMKEQLTILKKLRDECVTLVNRNLEIYGAFWNKTTFHKNFPSTGDTVNG